MAIGLDSRRRRNGARGKD